MEEEKKTNSKKSSEIAFKSVKIGNQEWMSDNLNVDHFRNGDIIPEVKSKDDWKEAGKNGQPAGGERSKSGKDKYISFVTSFWSSTELKEEEKTNIESWYKDDPIAWYWKIGYSRAAISRGILNQGHGVNVRCEKD